ncbi:hypothetical protein AL035_09045 [Salipiger aestuarii]|nr:hypothetical protein AL035_09045 [Salipiger aestuarii]
MAPQEFSVNDDETAMDGSWIARCKSLVRHAAMRSRVIVVVMAANRVAGVGGGVAGRRHMRE